MSQLPSQTGVAEFGATLKTVRGAKFLWGLLVILAILLHLAAFGLAEFTEKAPKKAPAKPSVKKTADSKPATQSATTGPATPSPAPGKGGGKGAAKAPKKDPGILDMTKVTISKAMPWARALAPVLCAILCVTLFLGAMVSLVGRTGGSTGFTSAFFWSLILLAILVPWRALVPQAPLTGALFAGGIKDIARAKNQLSGEMTDTILFYVRYVSYPVIALLLWLLVQTKFGRAYKATVGDDPSIVSISVAAGRPRKP